MLCRLVTAAVFQPERSTLKAYAFENIAYMVVTALVSQADSGWLKTEAL